MLGWKEEVQWGGGEGPRIPSAGAPPRTAPHGAVRAWNSFILHPSRGLTGMDINSIALSHTHTHSGASVWAQSRNKVVQREWERARIVENFCPKVQAAGALHALLPDSYSVEYYKKVSLFAVRLQLHYLSYKIVISRQDYFWIWHLGVNMRHFSSGFPERNRVPKSNQLIGFKFDFGRIHTVNYAQSVKYIVSL